LAANVALMGDEQGAAQRVQALALVELAAYSPPEFFAGDVAADAVGAHDPPVLVQRLDQGGLPAAGVQPGDEQAGGGVPGCSSPMAKDRTLVDWRRREHMTLVSRHSW
jgi:hypothetical protein